MSINSNAGGFIENHVADVAVTMIFGLGYYLFKGLKKKEDSWSDPKQNFKNLKGKLEGALERWQYAKTIEEYNELIKSNYEGIEDPFAIINLMNKRGILPTIETYNALLLNCLFTSNNESATTLKEEILDPMGPVTPNVYTLNVLIKGLNLNYKNIIKENESKENKLEKRMIFNQFDNDLVDLIRCLENRNIFIDVIVQNTILECLVDQARLDEAWSHYTNMKKCFSPDLYTYTTLLKGIKKTPEISSDWLDKAFLILEEARSVYTELDETFFNALLDSCVKFNRVDKAEELFEEIKEKKKVLSEYAYSIMIKAYAKVYKLDKASQMFYEIKKTQTPNTISYGAMLNACIRCKDISSAEKLLSEMTENKIEKNLHIYSTLINGYRLTKNYDKAIKLYETIKQDTTIQLNIVLLNSILDCCVDSNKIDKMNEIYNEIQDKASQNNEFPQLDIISYSIVMKGFAKSNRMDKVTEIYSYLRSRKDFKLDEILYNTIIDCYSKQNDEANVLKVYSDMRNRGIKVGVVTYGVLIKLYSNMGNCNKAFELFDECVKSDNKPTVVLYQMLIKLQVKSKYIDRAITLFRNMIINQVKPDQMIYELIIKACLEQEREKEAAEFVLNSARAGIKLERYIYDKLASGVESVNNNLKANEKTEFVTNFLNVLSESKIDIDRNVYERLRSLILSRAQPQTARNNYYKPQYTNTNTRNSYYNRNINTEQEECSIYDLSNNTSVYEVSSNQTNSHRGSYNNCNNNNSNYHTKNNYRNNKPYYSNRGEYEEERSIYS